MTVGVCLRPVVIQDQIAGWFRRLMGMAGNTTAVENRFDVAEILHGERRALTPNPSPPRGEGRIGPLTSGPSLPVGRVGQVAQARFVFAVPFLARLIVGLGGQQWRLLGQIEESIIGAGSSGLPEGGRLLAVGVAAAAVRPHLPWPQFVPRLPHVPDPAVFS